jgi:hypothetical protein
MIPDHAATPAASCIGSGVPFFAFSALVISRWLAPEVAVSTTVPTPCAPCGLRQEVIDAPSSARFDLSTIPIAHLAALTAGDVSIQPPYDPANFAAILALDQDRAAAMLAMLSMTQLAEQAVAYVRWLASYCLVINPQEVLAHWLALIAAHPSQLYDA